jgi:hypothetical protein
MSNGDLDKYLMDLAWRRLWTKGTPYYLPDAMLKGVEEKGIHVDAFGSLQIPKLGPIPLFDEEPWGSVSLTLPHSQLAGLPGVSPGTFVYTSSTKTFTAGFIFGPLTFSGAYHVDAGGAIGCALDVAKRLLPNPSVEVRPAGAGADGDDELHTAAEYRDRLVSQPTGSGMFLVGTYYDNNDVFNEVFANDKRLQFQWRTVETTGLDWNGNEVTVTSRDLAEQTNISAKASLMASENPAAEADAPPVGYPAYSEHSWLQQGFVIQALQRARDAKPVSDRAPYQAAIDATFAFKGAVKPQAHTQRVSDIVKTVADTRPPTDGGAALIAAGKQPLPNQAEIDRRIGEANAAYAAASGSEVEATGGVTAGETLDGSFEDSVSDAKITVDGNVTVKGTSPDLKLTATITKVTAELPAIAIVLRTGEGALFDSVQNAIANGKWFQDLLAQKLKSRLDSNEVKRYLSDRLNQSLAKVFGGS